MENILPSPTPSHNLTVVASDTTNIPFLFDFIQYVPDASVMLDNATIVVNGSDPQIQHPGWRTVREIGVATLVPGTSLTFDFIGAFHL